MNLKNIYDKISLIIINLNIKGGVMKKTKINFYLELIMLFQVLLLGASGWIIEHMFSCSGVAYGQNSVQTTFLWMERHNWGEIHSTIAVSLLAALAVHLLLHWNWIKVRVLELKNSLSKGETEGFSE